MDISEFNYFNSLKNKSANIQEQIVTEKNNYLASMANVKQLCNDYDVDTINELANVLNNAEDDQQTDDIKVAIKNHDKNYLLTNMKNLDNEEFQKIADLKKENQSLVSDVEDAEDFYKNFVLKLINDFKNNKNIQLLNIKSDADDSDTIVTIKYLATYQKFCRDFEDALYVPEIVKKHISQKTVMSVIFTEDNYPNRYDITFEKD